jgi:DNA-binding NarL/FixJ family response regulator
MWAESSSVQLCSASTEEAQRLLEQDQSYRMLIFSIGGDPLANALVHIETIHALAPHVPLVIMSDYSGAENIVLALHVGAVGYVHTGSILDIVLLALSFILKCGSISRWRRFARWIWLRFPAFVRRAMVVAMDLAMAETWATSMTRPTMLWPMSSTIFRRR